MLDEYDLDGPKRPDH